MGKQGRQAREQTANRYNLLHQTILYCDYGWLAQPI